MIRESQMPSLLLDTGWHLMSCLGTDKTYFSLSINHLIALYTHILHKVSLPHNYFLPPSNSLPLILSLSHFLCLEFSPSFSLHPLLILSLSLSLWWQCPAVMRQGQRSEIHLNTDATLWRPILSCRSTPPCAPHPNWWMEIEHLLFVLP